MSTKTKTPQSAGDVERNFFFTPRYATEILLPFIPKHVRRIWEPAAGHGYMGNVLSDSGYLVTMTDLYEKKE